MTVDTPHAAAADRNARPILGVIEHELRCARSVLEIGTGTAQQAVFFGHEMPWLVWQTSDLEQSHAGIHSRVEQSGVSNVLPPLLLDVRSAKPGPASYDAVYSSNTAHIMSMPAVEAMFRFVSRVLVSGGVFVLYGPFRLNGGFTTESNAVFDRSLRARDAQMGLRDLERLDVLAAEGGLRRRRLYAMPSNNFTVVWEMTGVQQ